METKSLGVGNARVIRAFGQEAHVLVSSAQTADAFCVFRVFFPPGNVTPPHLHRATDETFLIESGEIEINRGGELLRERRGDVIYLLNCSSPVVRTVMLTGFSASSRSDNRLITGRAHGVCCVAAVRAGRAMEVWE
jgi:hypothetical protein